MDAINWIHTFTEELQANNTSFEQLLFFFEAFKIKHQSKLSLQAETELYHIFLNELSRLLILLFNQDKSKFSRQEARLHMIAQKNWIDRTQFYFNEAKFRTGPSPQFYHLLFELPKEPEPDLLMDAVFHGIVHEKIERYFLMNPEMISLPILRSNKYYLPLKEKLGSGFSQVLQRLADNTWVLPWLTLSQLYHIERYLKEKTMHRHPLVVHETQLIKEYNLKPTSPFTKQKNVWPLVVQFLLETSGKTSFWLLQSKCESYGLTAKQILKCLDQHSQCFNITEKDLITPFLDLSQLPSRGEAVIHLVGLASYLPSDSTQDNDDFGFFETM